MSQTTQRTDITRMLAVLRTQPGLVCQHYGMPQVGTRTHHTYRMPARCPDNMTT